MSSKKVILKKKIGDEVFDILPKISADNVVYNEFLSIKDKIDNLIYS